MNINKSIEITDAKIQFVSLVDKAANKRQFLITKAEDGNANFSSSGKILKINNDTHYATGVVYEPLVPDAHDNFMTEEEIRKAAYWYAKNSDNVDVQHSFEKAEGLSVVENYIAPCDMTIEGHSVLKGTWLMTTEVQNDELWEQIQKGEITGFSMGGVGAYSEVETDLSDSVEKRSVLKKLVNFLGFDLVEKGAMTDAYKKTNRFTSFWDAFNTLENLLYKWDSETDRWKFEEDESQIRECLAEFSSIITDILSQDTSIAKSIAPVFKAGKEISAKNKEKLEGVYAMLGEFLSNFNDEKIQKEENLDMTEAEINALVEEKVAKALANAPAAPEAVPTEPVATPTAAEIENIVANAISKQLEPILKARGVSTVVDTAQNIKKEEPHYMHGLI